MPYLEKFFGNLKSKAMKVKYIILAQVKRNRKEDKNADFDILFRFR
jgi:hypothetical protein